MTASEARLPPACPEHRDLVRAALDPSAPDEVLERYAAEVTGCDACRRALAVRVGAIVPPSRDLTGMASLHAALAASARTDVAWPIRRRGWIAAAAAAAALIAVAAAVGWYARSAGVSARDTALTSAPAAPAAPTAPSPSSPSPSPSPSPAPPGPAPAPAPAPLAREPSPSAAPAPAQRLSDAGSAGTAGSDAVADAGDWPPPPFDDLRAGAPKSAAGPALRAVQLVVSRAQGDSRPPYQVGERVQFTVVASREAELAVCVSGPERGVVWRGAVPAGRSDLTHAGNAQAFAFAAPGTYRFTVGDGPDDPACGAPLHVVDVDVD